jgi:hypothetical protein
MSNRLTIYYSVENCGDGSAYPRFFDTKELAEWHQNHLDEGWGESCTGDVTVEGDNLRCQKLQTREGYYLTLLIEGYHNQNEIDEFVSEFFPDGLPEFTVEIVDPHHYGIFTEGRLVHKIFAYPEKNTDQDGIKRVAERISH